MMTQWIGEYEQITAMKTAGSGSARWCIAQRAGRHYFLKEFLAPVFPDGKEGVLANKQRERCEVFESEKRRMYAALSCVIGDTLVPVLDFFRFGRRYYAISEEVPKPHVSGEEIDGLTLRSKRELLYTLAECLMRLHAQGVIHADLKPEHLLLVKKECGYLLRLIDLDSGLLEGEKVGEEVEGDPVYLAPETFLRMQGEPVNLTTRMDTFAMGMIIHRLWTGELPFFERDRYSYLYEAVLDGGEVRLSSKLPLAYRFSVQRMLRKEPLERPSDEEIVSLLSASKQEVAPFSENAPPINALSRFMKKR